MKPAEAQELWTRLVAAYPRSKVTEDTSRLYLTTFGQLGHDFGALAVDAAIHACTFMPTIAEIHHHYGIVREQRRREHEVEERKRQYEIEDNMPRVPLREIPAVQDHLAKIRAADPEEFKALSVVEDGKCDDCKHDGTRYQYGSFQVCSRHASLRLAAKAKVEA